jgi:hypothetical protein
MAEDQPLLIKWFWSSASTQGEFAMKTGSAEQKRQELDDIIREEQTDEGIPVAFSNPLWIAVIAVAMFGAGVSLLLYFGN